MNGSEPMMPAEALASMHIALILPFIFLRSRSTRERLPSASERLPPAFCWMAMTMAKKFDLRQRHALVELARPPRRAAGPCCWVSTMRRNSRCTGSAASLAMMRRQSLSGRPDLMPRTMTSMRVRQLVEELLACRRLRRKLRNQRGRPKPPAKATPSATQSGCRSATNSDDAERRADADADDVELRLRPGRGRPARCARSSGRPCLRVAFCLLLDAPSALLRPTCGAWPRRRSAVARDALDRARRSRRFSTWLSAARRSRRRRCAAQSTP